MDARIGIFGSFGGIECMSEPFDHMEYRSYLSTSDLATVATDLLQHMPCANGETEVNKTKTVP